tara:strand:+ start:163 stop:657 length:495 start_codon:yes stop_codon:yes gene_type:complete
MKWIGQSIIDFIARFRSDVYLDSPTAGGSDPDKFLGIDSNNKVIYRTGVEVLDDIGVEARIDAKITLEDLDVAGDSGTAAVDLDSQSLTVTGGTGITTSATGQAVTVNVNAEQTGVTVVGTLTELTANDGETTTPVTLYLPTSDPLVAQRLWNDSGTVKISAGE